MRRLFLAVRAFWAVLLRREIAQRVHEVLSTKPAEAVSLPELREKPPAGKAPTPRQEPLGRSEALTLLATLQREARFVDFIMEPLDQYTDAQIGAAVRDIHRDCARAIQRIFGLRAIVAQAEGEAIELPAGYDAARFRVIGQGAQAGAVRARVIHRGWEATRCQLPLWSGGASAASVIAPAELEIEGATPPRLGEGVAIPPESMS
ncbi:MAG: DUF2760 domain-containing protein [Thermoguttaceae bacterium]|nr:DUF2760 domain-containing protein [Thermoguttaceae bacterium]MDW8077721.1 DUF2760 domain-containing protein [Thermoguttaceae bacterium]